MAPSPLKTKQEKKQTVGKCKNERKVGDILDDATDLNVFDDLTVETSATLCNDETISLTFRTKDSADLWGWENTIALSTAGTAFILAAAACAAVAYL